LGFARDAWIVEDDYISEFRYEAARWRRWQALDRNGRVIYIGTFSKTMFRHCVWPTSCCPERWCGRSSRRSGYRTGSPPCFLRRHWRIFIASRPVRALSAPRWQPQCGAPARLIDALRKEFR